MNIRSYVFFALLFTLSNQGAWADVFPDVLVVRFAKDSKLNAQWHEQQRKGALKGLADIVGDHTTWPFVSDAVLTCIESAITTRQLRSRNTILAVPPARPAYTACKVLTDLCVIKLNSSASSSIIAGKLTSHPDIVYAEAMPQYTIDGLPNDPLSVDQYHLVRTHAVDAWDLLTPGAEPIVVGIVDTGIDTAHVDLQDQFWRNPGETGMDSLGRDKRSNKVDDDKNGFVDDWYGWDFVGPDGISADNNPLPGNNHGTHVGGLVGALVNNNVGVAGMSPFVKLLPIKVGRDSPASRSVEKSGDGILYAAAMGARVVNCSFGSSSPSFADLDVVQAATELGALVVAAAGNASSEQAFYPAAHQPTLSVAATDETDRRVFFSNFHHTVDISAPGVNILSTVPDNKYLSQDGTSMASPIVAGVAAMTLYAKPNLTPESLRALLKATATNIDSVNISFVGLLGSGRLDALAAISASSARYADVIDVQFVDDNHDSLLVNGESVSITCRLHNILAPLNNARITITPAPSDFEPIIDVSASDVGAVATSDTATPVNAFRLQIPDDAPLNGELKLLVWIWDTDTLVGRQLITYTVNPSYRTLHENNIAVTITTSGNLGYNDYPDNTQGVGLTWMNGPSLLFESGLLIGTEPSFLPNVVRGADPNFKDNGFAGHGTVTIQRDVLPECFSATATFADSVDRFPVGLSVKETVFEGTADSVANSVVVAFDITNTTNITHKNVNASLFFDWDLGASGAEDGVAWDNNRGFAVVQNVEDLSIPTVGVAMVSPLPLNITAIDNGGGGGVPSIYDGFIRAEKWFTMSRGKLRTNSSLGDVSLMIGGGPFSLAPSETRQIVFCISVGKTLEDVTRYMNSARLYASTLGLQSVPYVPTAPQDHIESIANGPVYSPDQPITVRFALANLGPAELSVVDLLGRTVRLSVLESELAAGTYERTFAMPDGVPGVYFIVLRTATTQDAIPIQLLR